MFIKSLNYLHSPSSPADPKASELIPGQNSWCWGANYRLSHLSPWDPGARVLPPTQHNLHHFSAVMCARWEGNMGIIMTFDGHLDMRDFGWLLHILILIFVGCGDVNSFCEMWREKFLMPWLSLNIAENKETEKKTWLPFGQKKTLYVYSLGKPSGYGKAGREGCLSKHATQTN